MKTFTEEEVKNILVSVFLFAGSNNNQGISSIKGLNYGEMAQTVIDANVAVFGTNQSMISVVSKFK